MIGMVEISWKTVLPLPVWESITWLWRTQSRHYQAKSEDEDSCSHMNCIWPLQVGVWIKPTSASKWIQTWRHFDHCVAGRMVGRVVDSSHDYLGRWTRTILTGKGGKQIAVYNCYQVGNKNPSSCGKLTVINQLYSIYVQEGRQNTNPRYNHYNDMTEAITSDVSKGYSIILGEDFNQTIMDGSVGMSQLVQDCKLVDPIYYHHGIDNFNTCSRGSTVIDYIFVSKDIC